MERITVKLNVSNNDIKINANVVPPVMVTMQDNLQNIKNVLVESGAVTEDTPNSELASAINDVPKAVFKNTVLSRPLGMANLFFEIPTLKWADISKLIDYDATEDITNMSYAFGGTYNASVNAFTLDKVELFNTSKCTNATSMFESRCGMTELPNFDFSNLKKADRMCMRCWHLTKAPFENMNNLTKVNEMFYSCPNLIEAPKVMNTSNVTDFTRIFMSCNKLEEIPTLDLRNQSPNANNQPFDGMESLKRITLLNMKYSIRVKSDLLTLESLIGLCKECIVKTSTQTLTIGSANLEKLANVYVKLTGEPEVDETLPKLPMVVCEPTDEGAMLITDYMSEKGWTLA